MQMILGQSRFVPFGLPYWGLKRFNEGEQNVTALYDYHIGVDYHKAYSHLVVQDSAGKDATVWPSEERSAIACFIS